MKKVDRFSHAYESLQFFESRIEVVLDRIISMYRSKLKAKDDKILEKDEQIQVLERNLSALRSQSNSLTLQCEAISKQKDKYYWSLGCLL